MLSEGHNYETAAVELGVTTHTTHFTCSELVILAPPADQGTSISLRHGDLLGGSKHRY